MPPRGPRSFRYGARLAATAPLALVFLIVAGEMAYLAANAPTTVRVIYGAVTLFAALLGVAMVRTALVRVRGRRQVVLGAHELTVPRDGRGARDLAIPYRDIRGLELTGKVGFARALTIRYTDGEYVLAGVMLGSVGELDEIHALLKAARKR